MAMELWDPFDQAMSLRDAMDRLFQDSFIRPPSNAPARRGGDGAMLPLDVHESEDSYTVQASLPGVKPEDVQVQIAGDAVTIRAETREDREEKQGDQVILRERRMGAFVRTLRLPVPVDSEHAEATLNNGVLTLRLPKAQQARQRRLEVKSADGQQPRQVDARATSQPQQDGQSQSSQQQQSQSQAAGTPS